LTPIQQSSDISKQREKVWLLTTGSFCPIHKDHIEMMISVKNFLESSVNYDVIGGYISPTHDCYVSSKMIYRGFPNISAKHRLKMIELLLSEYTEKWIQASDWEMTRDRFYDFPEVYSHFQKEFLKQNIKLIYVCGADHAINCGLLSTQSMHVTVVQRGSKPLYSGSPSVMIVSSSLSDKSSTEVRKLMTERKYNELCEMVGPSVKDYIIGNNSFDFPTVNSKNFL